MPEVDLVLGNREKERLFDHLDDDGQPRTERVAAAAHDPGRTAFTLVTAFAGHTRAFVKIQDGCDAGCAYCIVPQARGSIAAFPSTPSWLRRQNSSPPVTGRWCSPACTWAPGAATLRHRRPSPAS